MRITSVNQFIKSVKSGEITEGMIFSDTTGIYVLKNIDDHPDYFGTSSTCVFFEIDENGDPTGEEGCMTVYDFLGTDF